MNPRLQTPRLTHIHPDVPPPWLPIDKTLLDIQSWVEAPIGDTWVAAYRLALRDDRPVIAEIRVFPAEPPVPGHSWGPGVWSGTWNPQPMIPGAGINRALLKQVPTALVFDYIRDLQQQMETYATAYWARKGVAVPPRPDVERPKDGRGRRAKPDLFYAEIARDYVAALDAKTQPAREIARAKQISQGLARAYVKRARDRGFLTAAPTGQKFGKLTEAAHRVLRAGKRAGAPKRKPR